MTDGDVQLHIRRILEGEARFSTIFLCFRNREILPRRFVVWEECLICGFFDCPSDREEPEPFLARNHVQVSLGDGDIGDWRG